MPIITIRSIDAGKKLDLQKIRSEISEKTGIDSLRLQLMAEYYPSEDFLTSGAYSFIHIAAADNNGKELIQELMKACVSAVAAQFEVEPSRISAFSHPIGAGYLMVKNQFI